MNQGILPATSCDPKDNTPPVAVPGPNRTVPAQSVVVFDGTGSYDPNGGPIDTYTWYFGDGGFSREAVAEHVYAIPGMYMVRLMVTDVCGAVGRKDIFVIVTPAEDHSPCDNNVPPIADAGPDQTVDAGVTVYFAGSVDATHATHDWDFGDGSAATGRYVAHVFSAPGVYTVTLTVTDDCGDSAVDHATVTVNQPDPCAGNLPPSANAGSNRTMQTNVAAWFFGQGSDLDGFISPATGYHWNFGDGTTSNQRNVSKAFTSPGVYTVTLTVTDNCGATGSHSITATVTNPDPCLNNQAPVAVAGPNRSAEVGEPITFDGSNSYDNDGEITTYRWTFGDGSPAKFGAVVTHAYANAATYTAILTVTDNCNRTATASVLVTITAPQEDPGEDIDELSDFDVLPSETLRVFEPVTFRSVLAGHSEADRYYFYWDFGDGVRGFGAPEQARTAYTTPGVREVSLTLYHRVTWAAETTVKEVVVNEGIRHVVTLNAPADINPGENTWGLEIDENTSIAWTGVRSNVLGIDISNPENPAVAAVIEIPSWANDVVWSLAIQNSILAVANINTLWLFDVGDPQAPRLLLDSPGERFGARWGVSIWDMRFYENYLYVAAAGSGGVFIFDVSQQLQGIVAGLDDPVAVSYPPHPGHYSSNVSLIRFARVNGRDYGFFGQTNTDLSPGIIRVVSMDDPLNPQLLEVVGPMIRPLEIAVQDYGERALLCAAQSNSLTSGWASSGTVSRADCYELRADADSVSVTHVAALRDTFSQVRSVVMKPDRLFLSGSEVFEYRIDHAADSLGVYEGGISRHPKHVIMRHVPAGLGPYLITKHHNGWGSVLAVFTY